MGHPSDQDPKAGKQPPVDAGTDPQFDTEHDPRRDEQDEATEEMEGGPINAQVLLEHMDILNPTEKPRKIATRVEEIIDKKLLRFLHGEDGIREMLETSLDEAIDETNRNHGWNLTRERLDKARILSIANLRDIPIEERTILTQETLHFSRIVVDVIVGLTAIRMREKISPEGRFRNFSNEYKNIVSEAQEQAHLEFKANRDDLTGLLNNREAVRDLVVEAFEEFTETGEDDEVMLWIEADFIGFKELNLALTEPGVDEAVLSPIGSEVFAIAGKALNPQEGSSVQSRLRVTDIVARFGGDELSFCLTGVKREHIRTVMEKIRDIIQGATYDRTKLDPLDLKVRVRLGAHVIEKADVPNFDPSDAKDFINNQLRLKATQATLACKVRPDSGDMVIWEPGVETEIAGLCEVDDLVLLAGREMSPTVKRLRDLGISDRTAKRFAGDVETLLRTLLAEHQQEITSRDDE